MTTTLSRYTDIKGGVVSGAVCGTIAMLVLLAVELVSEGNLADVELRPYLLGIVLAQLIGVQIGIPFGLVLGTVVRSHFGNKLGVALGAITFCLLWGFLSWQLLSRMLDEPTVAITTTGGLTVAYTAVAFVYCSWLAKKLRAKSFRVRDQPHPSLNPHAT